MLLERFAQDLQPAHELPAHDGMLGVNLFQGSPLIFDIGAEETGGELKLHLLKPVLVCGTKKEADHPVVEDPIDEGIHDLAQLGLPAQSLV